MCHVNAFCGNIYFFISVMLQVPEISLMIIFEQALWKASPIEGTWTEVDCCHSRQ